MNEQVVNEQYAQICLLINNKRLKEALTQLESYLWQGSDWNLRRELEQLQTSYNYMLQYMQQGVADPKRNELYATLQIEALEITDQARLLLLDGISSHYYHDCRKKRTSELATYTIGVLMHILESFNDDLAVSGLLSDTRMDEVLKRREDTQKFLFLQTWTNSAWTPTDEAEALGMLQSEQLPVADLCLFTSAVTLSLLECFDIRKLLWLLAAYRHTNVQVNQRALAGIAFAFHRHSDRIKFYPIIESSLKLLSFERPVFEEELARIQRQILLCQETEKIDKKMREEILPEMLKNVSSMRDMKFGFEESDEEKDDQNPAWANMLEQSGLGDKLREMNDLQIEGADVYMSTFSALKSTPFFREVHHWFYPFDKQHSSVVRQIKNENQKYNLIDLILQSGFFCDSDKYSLFFMMQSFPQSQRDMIFSQLTEQQLEDFAEQSKAESLKKFSERPATVCNCYLHDLYRFFKLNQRKQEFRDIFKESIQLYNIPALQDILYNEDFLLNLANYYLKKEHWKEAIELYRIVESMNSRFNSKDEFYQQMGYALQKSRQYEEAISAYLKADTIKPDNVWTNRHLATCYRMTRQFGEALTYYRKVEETAPENKNILFYIGNCLAELHQYDEALNLFFKLDFLEANCIKAWRGIGWCSFVSGKHEQAAKYYNKVIDKKPLTIDYLNAGHASWAAGKVKEAIALYSKAAAQSESRGLFFEMFDKDKHFLITQGIAKDDIPLMIDLIE